MSTAIIKVEPGIFPASQPPESLTNDQLVEIAVDTFQRIQDSMPYIVELRKRFKAAPRGKAQIGGCDRWEQFCETHLHRTASALRKAIQAEQTGSTPERRPQTMQDLLADHRKHRKPVKNIIRKLINAYTPRELLQIASRLLSDGTCPSPKYLDSFYVLQDGQRAVLGDIGTYGTDWGARAFRFGRHFDSVEHARSEMKRLKVSDEWQIVQVKAEYKLAEPHPGAENAAE